MNTSLDTGCAGRDYEGCWYAKLNTSGIRQRYAYCRKQKGETGFYQAFLYTYSSQRLPKV